MVTKLDLYKIFFYVGKNKSISKAAKELFMTQPAVSQAIMQIERELETQLFHRMPRGVRLTQEGEHLFEYIQSAMHFIEAGEEKLLEFKGMTVGELKIGVGDTISRYFLLPFLEHFHSRYPKIKLKIINGTTFEICSSLKERELDIAFCNFPLEDPMLDMRPCMDVHDVFVCGDKFRFLLNRPIALKELLDIPLITLESKANSRKYMEAFLLSKGIEISPEFELGSHDLLLEFARINLGVACVTREFSMEYIEKGLLYEIELQENIPKRSIGVCYVKDVPLLPASIKFLEIVHKGK